MSAAVFRFEFADRATCEEAELTLHLALCAVEGLFGAARVRLDAGYHADPAHLSITVDGTTEVGVAVLQVFTALALREFGESAFRVRPLTGCDNCCGRAA